MMRAMMYFRCANLPIRWNVAVFRTSTSCVENLAVTVLAEPCIHGSVMYQSNKVQSLATYTRGFHSVGFRAPAEFQFRRQVNCSAAGKSSKEMPPRKKSKPSSKVTVEDYFEPTSTAKEEDQSPGPRTRKSKPSSTVKEEDERTEARVGKLGDKTVDSGPSDSEGRPPLSQGVHPGTLPSSCHKCLILHRT